MLIAEFGGSPQLEVRLPYRVHAIREEQLIQNFAFMPSVIASGHGAAWAGGLASGYRGYRKRPRRSMGGRPRIRADPHTTPWAGATMGARRRVRNRPAAGVIEAFTIFIDDTGCGAVFFVVCKC